jgi:hypothetical protein
MTAGHSIDSRFWYEQIYGEDYKRAEAVGAASGWWDALQLGRVTSDWAPPKYRIVGGAAWPDWMASWVPLWSERAVEIMQPLVSDACQLIPWVSESGRAYSLVNVLAVIPRAEWHCEDSTEYGGQFASANVITLDTKTLPPIFRMEDYSGKTFVSDQLARRSFESGLTGVEFVHPLIHETDSLFLPRRFGRRGTGFVIPSAATKKDLH